jgi:hypothetical protein
MAHTHEHRKLTTGFLLLVFLLPNLFTACSQNEQKAANRSEVSDTISADNTSKYTYSIQTPVCTEEGCSGKYTGPEFVDEQTALELDLTGTDIAHNYSNLMAKHVGEQLKVLYKQGKFVKVDFANIQMTTQGMNDGDEYVEYEVSIPFVRVKSKQEAMTSFDHSGGWGHAPELAKRKAQLLNSPSRIVKNNKLWISPLLSTPEGLQEYWIQWQHRDY